MSEALKSRKITHTEARKAWERLHDALYCGGPRPSLCIPRCDTDVDMVLYAYFEQQEKLEAALSRTAPDREATICKCGHWLTEHTHTPTEYMECNREECECAGFALAESPSESAPAPEGMGRDAKFELRHHTCEFASNFPDPPIMEEEPYDGTLSDEKGTWRKFMCPICHDRIVIQFLAHPTSESGTDDLRFQVGKLLEEQGEDFRLAHAELLDAYHAMEAESGTDEERRKQFAKDLEDYAHKCQLAEKPCDANAFNVGWLAHEAKAESGRVEEHKPMTHLDGRRIEGLLRCENCGLSQTYWERWPSCPASHSQPSVKEK